MDSIGQAKPNAEQEEVVKPGRLHQLPLPAELESLESHDLEKLEKGLVRRLDSCLLPAVVILFLMNILNRNNVANAKIAGLPKTSGITNTQYNTCFMIFYVGYIITQLPSNLVITKVKPSVYIGVVTAAWGIVSMCQAFTHNFAGLFVSSLYLEWLFIIEGSMTVVIALLVIPFIPDYFPLDSI
ncbi:uncharacterized protein N7473_003792 [Penicillium subrubescens]|uniref:uncharacterized protein n=1 Tax=Penicillium subrubescens TaxID=1316194 RepID=UPI002545474E|nr:uncharacterized protein N7473_003792 [Penicillium subrubescens]KAJ5906876.1 hypothetical protein N7473_003792 [Penicillium subrubescens]